MKHGGWAVLGCWLLAGCVEPGTGAYGLLQPQVVEGQCRVKSFFLIPLSRSFTDMTVENTPQACQFSMFDPDLQFVQSGALITEQPSHGQAAAALIEANRMSAVAYRPAPNYLGHDEFTATIEPGDRTVTVRVTVVAPNGMTSAQTAHLPH